MALYARCLRVPGIIRNNTSQFFRPQSLKYPRLPIVNVSEDQSEAEVILPGFSYDDIDRIGNISPWKLARLGEAVRMTVNKYMPDLNRLFGGDNILGFLVTANYKIYDSYYEKEHYFGAARVHLFLAGVGNTSVSLGQHIYSASGKLLATNIVKLVRVDKLNRRPVPLLLENKQFLQDRIQHTSDIVYMKQLEKPGDVRPVKRTVMWSNLDFYQHSNHSAYIQYCLDAIMVASSRPEYSSQLPRDIAQLRMRAMQMLYLGETSAGDTLDIYVWTEPSDDLLKVNCIVEKDDGAVFHFHASFDKNVKLLSKL